MAALPHRYPFLLIDRVESLVPKKRIVAIKAVTINEPFFQGHFPGRPIMPGALLVEAMAQASRVLAVESPGLAGTGTLVYFMPIDSAKFRRPVEPGVLPRIEVELVQGRGGAGQLAAQVLSDGTVVAGTRCAALRAHSPSGCGAASRRPAAGRRPPPPAGRSREVRRPPRRPPRPPPRSAPAGRHSPPPS